MTDLWSEASYDYDAERRARNLEMAKAASQGTWAFLALAQSPEEFGDRVALASDQIMATAAQYGVDMRELTDIFNQRFALLMEAKGNPFADDSDDSDDSSDDSDSDDDSQSDDSDDSSDSDDDDSDDSSDDDSDSDSDDSSDDDSDDSGDSDDSDDDAKGKSQQGFQPFASRYAALAARIEAGEDPLTWGSAPFVHSSARKEAADGAPAQVSDVNTPQPGTGGMDAAPTPPGGAPDVPGMNGGIAETTKPRQMPAGGGMDTGSMPPGMGMDGIPVDDGFDPATNGGDIQQGADDLPPATSSRGNKLSAIMREVKRYNPTLSNDRCWKIATQVYDQYLHKHAEDMNPLLFGDRGGVADGPATNRAKNWSPPDFKPVKPDGEGAEQGGGDEPPGAPKGPAGGTLPKILPKLPAAGEGAGLAGAIGEAAELLPLLAL